MLLRLGVGSAIKKLISLIRTAKFCSSLVNVSIVEAATSIPHPLECLVHFGLPLGEGSQDLPPVPLVELIESDHQHVSVLSDLELLDFAGELDLVDDLAGVHP